MIQVAAVTAVLLFVIQVLVLVYILYKKSKAKRFEAKVEKYFTKNLSAYLSFISGEHMHEPRLPESGDLKKEILERILNEVSGNSSDPEQLSNIQRIAQSHLSERYETTLLKGKWADRVNTLYFIEDFKMTNVSGQVWQHLTKIQNKDEEYRQTLRVLASFQDERLIDYLIQEQDISLGLIKELLRRLNSGSFEYLVSLIEDGDTDVPQVIEEAFISYCGESRNYEFMRFVERKIEDDRKEIRLKAFRSLCNYQYTSDTNSIKAFFSSEYWEERMYAARLSGIMNLEEYISDLIRLAGDSTWWVRFAACEAIKINPGGEDILHSIVSGHEDSYARDMAKQTLTMKGGM
ncbi:HEAT repeat domain-containing protein [Salisediminibacterium beveridgei]|uniref:HEAT repeat-containing protein n=1 Tax=Salisediminibacterium beveridgei TaxID=632773 RepID=A0A1D7QXA8_9BACI|nr:HEAT repeat domain-containing protein [Salisediminibacterium beveridgei]AOM83641.1 hypothetical protein BBEV_2300 [Salisediminibacterium beveridgei]